MPLEDIRVLTTFEAVLPASAKGDKVWAGGLAQFKSSNALVAKQVALAIVLDARGHCGVGHERLKFSCEFPEEFGRHGIERRGCDAGAILGSDLLERSDDSVRAHEKGVGPTACLVEDVEDGAEDCVIAFDFLAKTDGHVGLNVSDAFLGRRRQRRREVWHSGGSLVERGRVVAVAFVDGQSLRVSFAARGRIVLGKRKVAPFAQRLERLCDNGRVGGQLLGANACKDGSELVGANNARSQKSFAAKRVEGREKASNAEGVRRTFVVHVEDGRLVGFGSVVGKRAVGDVAKVFVDEDGLKVGRLLRADAYAAPGVGRGKFGDHGGEHGEGRSARFGELRSDAERPIANDGEARCGGHGSGGAGVVGVQVAIGLFAEALGQFAQGDARRRKMVDELCGRVESSDAHLVLVLREHFRNAFAGTQRRVCKALERNNGSNALADSLFCLRHTRWDALAVELAERRVKVFGVGVKQHARERFGSCGAHGAKILVGCGVELVGRQAFEFAERHVEIHKKAFD